MEERTMKSCTKCGFMNNDSDNFCKHCGQDLTEFENSLKQQKENFNQQEAYINQTPESSVYAQQQNTNANIDAIKQKPKKKSKKIIIPCVSIILVIAIIVITFVLKIPQKYFGDPFVESTVVTEEADNDNGLRFNFDEMGFQKLNTNAVNKLNLKTDQHGFLAVLLDTVEKDCESFGVSATQYELNREDTNNDRIGYWINLYKENRSDKINFFEICMRIKDNNRDDLDKVMTDYVRQAICMLNPELGIFKINELAENLECSGKYDSDGYKTLFYNNVCYKIYDNPYRNLYALCVYPLTKTEYGELTEGNTAPNLELRNMSDQEYYNKIIGVLKSTSYCEDYLPAQLSAGACNDMSYGELIAMMFKSPDISVDRTGDNSCTVTVSGRYRSYASATYDFNGTIYIQFSDVEAGDCTLSGSYEFEALAKYFALSY